MPRVLLHICSLESPDAFADLDCFLRDVYKTSNNVSCAALLNASYFSFKQFCSNIKPKSATRTSAYRCYLDQGIRLEVTENHVIVTQYVPVVKSRDEVDL